MIAKNVKLGDYVDILVGVTASKSSDYKSNVLPVKAIVPNNIDYGAVSLMNITTKTAEYIKQNDILMANRGKFSIAMVGEDLPKDDISVPSFVYIIRPKDDKEIRPDFLYWYLMTPTVQARMQNLAAGKGIPFISKKALDGLEIKKPDTLVQDKIKEINGLHLSRQKAQRQLMAEQDIYIESKLTELMQGEL